MGRTGRLRYRHLRRTVIAASAALAVFLLLVLLLWRTAESDAVCAFTARRLEGVCLRQTGFELNIGDLRWGLIPLRLELSDVVLKGEGTTFEAPRARLELGGLWVARRTLVIDGVAIDGLRVVLRDPSPLPRREKRPGAFRVVVRNLDLKDAALSGSGLPGKVGLDIEGFEVSWVRDGAQTTGFLAAEAVDFRIPGLEGVAGRLATRFVRRGAVLELPNWRVAADGISLGGRAELSSDRTLAEASGQIDLGKLDRLIRTKGLLEGEIEIDAEFDSTERLLARADISSERVTVADLPLTDLEAEVALSRDGLHGDVLHARLFDGWLSGSYELGRLGAPYPHRVEASCDGLLLADFLEGLGVPSGGLSSRASVEAEVGWNSSRFPEGRGTATIELAAVDGPLPTSGSLELTLTPSGLLQFDAAALEIGTSSISLEGPLRLQTWEPEWALHAEPIVLEEILPAVNRWVGSKVIPEVIGGAGVADITLSGPWRRVRAGIRLDVHNLSYPPLMLDRAIVESAVVEGAWTIGQGRFRLGAGGGDVRGALRWDPAAGEDELDLRFEGRQLSLDRVASWIGLEDHVDAGRCSFTGGLGGKLASPRGSWALGMTGVEISGQALGDGSASVDLSAGVFTLGNLSFDRGLGGMLRWWVTADKLEGDLEWKEMEASGFPPVLKRLFGNVFTWGLDFALPLQGGAGEGSLRVEADRAGLTVHFDQTGLAAEGELDGVAAGEVTIVGAEAAGEWQGRGGLRVESAAALVNLLAPDLSLPLSGTADVRLDLDGEGSTLRAVTGALEQTALEFGGQTIQVLQDEGFSWDEDGFRLRGLETEAGADRLFLRAAIDPAGDLTGNLAGTIDGRLLRLVIPEWEPAGRATGVIEILGSLHRPLFEGVARVEAGSFHLPGSSSVIGDVNGAVFLSAGEIALEDIGFRLMRGAGRCRGKISLRDELAGLDLAGTIEGLRFPLFEGLEPWIYGSWALEGPVEDLELSGDLVVRRAEVRRKDDLPTLLMDWFGTVGPPREESLRLNLHVRAEETLKVQGPFLRVAGSADLHITGTDADPGLVGRVEFLEGGEFTLQGIRYELERGQISFSDPLAVDPLMDFQARSRILEYEVWLRLSGTLDRLVPTVSSDPPLSQAEIFSLMAMGQVGEGRAGGALGLSLASSMLTRQLNQTLGGRDSWLMPVDQIRVDPFIESTTGNPAARVTVVKQLSPSLTVTLQSNLSGEGEEVISARWYLGTGFFVEATRDVDASLGFDLKLRRRY